MIYRTNRAECTFLQHRNLSPVLDITIHGVEIICKGSGVASDTSTDLHSPWPKNRLLPRHCKNMNYCLSHCLPKVTLLIKSDQPTWPSNSCSGLILSLVWDVMLAEAHEYVSLKMAFPKVYSKTISLMPLFLF